MQRSTHSRASLPVRYEIWADSHSLGISNGQKQRAAIVRMLARSPQILLLDKVTAILDSGIEALVRRPFETAKTGGMVIAAAHRLSTVRVADVVSVCYEGRDLRLSCMKGY
jgi:ATP-binding cassette subfamily B protein